MRWIPLAVLVGLMGGVFVPPALAIKEFKKPFLTRYVDAEQEPEFAKAVRKANCNLCHVKGEKKNVCNPYGEALGRLIEGNAHERLKAAKATDSREEELDRVLAELAEAFPKVEQMTDQEGRQFGDLIRQRLLPVAVVEDGVDADEAGDEDE